MTCATNNKYYAEDQPYNLILGRRSIPLPALPFSKLRTYQEQFHSNLLFKGRNFESLTLEGGFLVYVTFFLLGLTSL